MSRLPDRQSPCRIDAAKGCHRHPCSTAHADLVQSFHAEQHAQQLRAEAATHGYATEMAAYFGDDGEANAVERRVTWKDWLRGHRERAQWHEAA